MQFKMLSGDVIGFYMDRAQNRIGQSGWNTISGQSIREFFSR